MTDSVELGSGLTPDTESSGPVQATYAGVENRQLRTGGDESPSSSLYYPVFQNEKVNGHIKHFIDALAESYASEVNESMGADGERPESWDRWEQTGTFTISRPVPDIVSVTFDVYRYTGGAHGQIYIAVFNFNLKDGQLLSLGDLFGDPQKALEIMSAVSREKLTHTLGEDAEEDMLREGTEPTEVNFSNLSLLPAGIAVEFQPYQVGPWAIGQQHVEITLKELATANPSKLVWPVQ